MAAGVAPLAFDVPQRAIATIIVVVVCPATDTEAVRAVQRLLRGSDLAGEVLNEPDDFLWCCGDGDGLLACRFVVGVDGKLDRADELHGGVWEC